jgi:Na+-transporting NADH:ubiquinone oxidoreductase subunit F
MIPWTAIVVLSAVAGGLGVVLALLDRYLGTYGECKIYINDNEPLVVQGGNSILQYLIDHKIFIPSACGGRATCGFCKLKVLEGGGLVLPTETPFLSKDEIRQGVRLVCQVKVKQDVRLVIPEAYLKVQRFRTQVTEMEDLTHDIKRIVLKLLEPDTIESKPGQYIQFEVPGTNEFRAYSMSSPPSWKHAIEIIVRLVPGGLCTGYIFHRLKVGDMIYVTGPYGDFYLREDSQRDIICVAGGSGVAPIKSIITHLFEKGTTRRVTYFFGARAVKDLYFYHECLELARKHPNFTYVAALSAMDPGDQWDGETGFIHTIVDKMISTCENTEAYLCGPPVMIDAVIEVLKRKGMPESNIYFDKF